MTQRLVMYTRHYSFAWYALIHHDKKHQLSINMSLICGSYSNTLIPCLKEHK